MQLLADAAVRSRSYARPFTLLDVFPTLSELAALPPPVRCAGVSHVSALQRTNASGGVKPRDVHGAVLHAFFYHPEYNAISTTEWRYIEYGSPATSELCVSLFVMPRANTLNYLNAATTSKPIPGRSTTLPSRRTETRH